MPGPDGLFLSPTTLAKHARAQAGWRAWCAKPDRNHDPDTAGGAVAARYLAGLTCKDGTPSSSRTLADAAVAIDALPARAALPAVREHPDVVTQIEAAARTHRRRSRPRVVMDVPVARLIFGLPVPAVPEDAAVARCLLATARRDREPLPTAAVAAARGHRLPPDLIDRALDLLAAAATPTGPAQDLWHDDPAALSDDDAHQLWHRLHPDGMVDLRDKCGFALGLHCALTRRGLIGTERDALTLTHTGLALSLPGGTARARRANDPVLCAVRHTNRWLRATGPRPPDSPLLCRIDPVTGAPLPDPLHEKLVREMFARAARATGLDTFTSRSMQLGYLAIGDQQGATIPQLAAGARLEPAHVLDVVTKPRNRTVA